MAKRKLNKDHITVLPGDIGVWRTSHGLYIYDMGAYTPKMRLALATEEAIALRDWLNENVKEDTPIS